LKVGTNSSDFSQIARYVATSVLLSASSLAQSHGVVDANLKEFNDRVKKYVGSFRENSDGQGARIG